MHLRISQAAIYSSWPTATISAGVHSSFRRTEFRPITMRHYDAADSSAKACRCIRREPNSARCWRWVLARESTSGDLWSIRRRRQRGAGPAKSG